ncbi:MAG: cytochrome c [Bacteroidota bacterium]
MKPWVKRTLKILGWIVAVLVVALLGLFLYVQTTWDTPVERPTAQMVASRDSATIARGEFLFKYSATCWMCHTPTLRVSELPSGGEVYDLRDFGPGFGTFYVKNITPDDETGIGTWTDGEIVRAIREGIGKDGRTFFIMPSRAFNRMSDDDALAIAAYLKSLPPVRNPIPAHQYNFPIKALYAFKMIQPQPPITAPVQAPTRAVSVEWGKYLANHASTCTDCHSPLDVNTGQFYTDSLFMGGNFAIGEPFGSVPEERIDPIWAFGKNLTPDPETGIGNWTEEQFVMAVKAGMRPDGTVLVGSAMPYPYYALWEDDDVKAMYAYFRTLKPVRKTVPAYIVHSQEISSGSGVPRGKALFRAYCQNCHGENGTGAPATKTTMAELAPTIDDQVLKEFISNGQLNLYMPAFGKTLTADQLEDVVAFIRSWETKADSN